jgi:A/G-specific adenine glycosylase
VTNLEIAPDPNPIRRRLIRWYDEHRRHLPWRETRDPYAIWVSEIMLQQTQVETVIPYYRRFLEKFPTVETLAVAEPGEVIKSWENLGYYARVRNLHLAARRIAERFGGRIPDEMEEILRLPGVGRYTAGAILSIAYGRPVPAVDGNVRRVVSRLFAVLDSIDDPKVQQQIDEQVGLLVPKRDPGRFNQSLMELGALCCTPKSPACPACPLQGLCRARSLGIEGRLPLRREKKTIRHREVVAAVILDEAGRILVVQRPEKGLLGALWKFPGGFLMPREPAEEGLGRTVRDELAIGIGVGSLLATVSHAYTHFRITLRAYAGFIEEGRPAGPAWQWADAAQLEALPFSRADRRIARLVAPLTDH